MANPLDTIIGASKNFNAIVSNFEKIKKLVQDGKEDEIDTLKAKVEPERKDIESKIKAHADAAAYAYTYQKFTGQCFNNMFFFQDFA